MSTVTTYPLPDIAAVRELLGMLFDQMQVKVGGKLDVSAKSASFFGVYSADDGAPGALCACDLAFAAGSAASLSMLPPNAAASAIKAKELPEVMVANLREVMNICSRLVIRDGTPHLKLTHMGRFADLPPAAAAIVAAPKGRIDFEIQIGKYGTGVIAVLTL